METIRQNKELVCKTRGIRNTSTPGFFNGEGWGWKKSARTPIDTAVVRAQSETRSRSDGDIAFFSPRHELYPASALSTHLNHCLQTVLLPKLRIHEQITGVPIEDIHGEIG